MHAKEVRELRVYLLVTAIVAFFLNTGLYALLALDGVRPQRALPDLR